MQSLHIKPSDTHGRVMHITPQRAQWTYTGLDVYQLKPGQNAHGMCAHNETCLVWVHGSGSITINKKDYGIINGRSSPFDGLPHAVYVPANTKWEVTAHKHHTSPTLCLAVCSALVPTYASTDTIPTIPMRHIPQTQCTREVRGEGNNTRYITNILMDNQPAHSLYVVEVITPAGHSSSYPPHKHDKDHLPTESKLEEIYYHRFQPHQGFGFQRVYTDNRDIDQAMAVENGDCVLVPRGYHPCNACHGYTMYYLNVMAGPKRVWKFTTDPHHKWLVAKNTHNATNTP